MSVIIKKIQITNKQIDIREIDRLDEMAETNILILSCGTRNKIVQYFENALGDKGKLIATDCSKLAPALYDADIRHIVPEMTAPGYLDEILTICKKNDVKALLSLIDPELSLVAENAERFLDLGVMPIVSDYDLIELCLDKYAMNEFLLENNLNSILSYIDKEEFYQDLDQGRIDFPVFLKPNKGSASININKVYSREELELLWKRNGNLIIQEYMDGIEFGVDAYVDMLSLEPVAIFCKEKIKMRAGETDKSVSIKDDRLFGLIKDFVTVAGFKGIIDIDIFIKDGEYYISEVNPRFGGGYPHAYACGVDVPQMIINNVNGIVNENVIGMYEEDVYMMKYNEIKIEKLS